MKKALIYNPYWDTFGGGEFYVLSVIQVLFTAGYQVEVCWQTKDIFLEYQRRFQTNIIDKITINKIGYNLLTKKGQLFKKYFFLHKYDLILFVSDGSIPFLFGKKNFLLFQAPILNSHNFLLNKLKLRNIHHFLCYSHYVKKFIDQKFKIKAKVINPFINNSYFHTNILKKKNLILTVGRFDEQLNTKKQDILIMIFKSLFNQGLKNWKLILIGGIKDKKKLNYYYKLSKGYPIKIITNASFKKLQQCYQEAKIYWHATGFQEDLSNYPQKAEHFGITMIEAMASGAIPLYFNAGGLKEILPDQKFQWQTIEELKNKTLNFIKNKETNKAIISKLKSIACKYNQKNFNTAIFKLIKE